MKVTKKLKLLLTSALAVCCIATAAVGVSMASNTTASAAEAKSSWNGAGGGGKLTQLIGASSTSCETYGASSVNILDLPGKTGYFSVFYNGEPNPWHALTLQNGGAGKNLGWAWTLSPTATKEIYPWHTLIFKNKDGGQIGEFGGRISPDGLRNQAVNNANTNNYITTGETFEIHIGTGTGDDHSYIKLVGGKEWTLEDDANKSILANITEKDFPDGCYLLVGLIFNAGGTEPGAISDVGRIYATDYSVDASKTLDYKQIKDAVTIKLNAADAEGFGAGYKLEVGVNGNQLEESKYSVSVEGQVATVTVPAASLNEIDKSLLETLNYLSYRVLKADGTPYGGAVMPFGMSFEAPPVLTSGAGMILQSKDEVKITFTYDGEVDLMNETGSDALKIAAGKSYKLSKDTGTRELTKDTEYTLSQDSQDTTKYTITITKSCIEELLDGLRSYSFRITFGKHTINVNIYLDEKSEYGVYLREGIDYADGTLTQDEYYTSAELKKFSEADLSSRIFYEEPVDVSKPFTVEYSTLDPSVEWLALAVMSDPTISGSFTEGAAEPNKLFSIFFGQSRVNLQGLQGWSGDFSFSQNTSMKNNIVEIFIGTAGHAEDGYMKVNDYKINGVFNITQADFPAGTAYIGFFANNQKQDHYLTVNSHVNAPAITAPQADRDYAMDLGAAKDFTLTMLNADGTLELKDETGTALSESEFSYADGKLTIKAAYFQRRLFKKEGTIYVWNSTTQKGTAFKLAFSHSGIQTATIGFTSNTAPTDTVFELSGVTNVDYVIQNGEAVDAANYSFDSGKLTLKAAAIKNEIGAQEFIVGSSGKLYPCYVLANAWNNGIASTGTVAAETNGYVLTDLASFTQQKVYDLTAGYTFGFDLRTIATYRENGLNQTATNLSLKFFDPYTGYTLYITLYANYADDKIGSSTPALYLEYGVVDSEGTTVPGSSKGTRNVTAETAKAIHSIQIKENKGGLTLTVNGRDYNIGESALVGFNFKACVLSGDTTTSAAGSVVALSIQEGLVDVGGTTPGGDPTPPPAGHEHTFSDQWTYDENNHWHAATCDDTTEKKDSAAHTFGDDGKCTVCGYERGTTPPPTEEPSKGCGTIAIGGSGWGGGIALGILAVGAALVMFLRKKRA